MLRSAMFGKCLVKTFGTIQRFLPRQSPLNIGIRFLSERIKDDEAKTVKDEDYFKRFVKNRGFKEGQMENEFSSIETNDPLLVETDLAIGNNLSHVDLTKEIDIDLKDIRPVLKQAGNLAAYVNESETLKKLVQVGVNLHEIENAKERDGADLLMQLDFEADIQPIILWLTGIGVSNNEIGKVISKNPLILGKSIDELKAQVGYLEMKRFSPQSISRIIEKAPKFLTIDIKEADGKLGFYQKEFSLTGQEVRDVATKLPKLLTFPLSTAKWSKFALREFLGFSEAEAKDIFVTSPKSLLTSKNSLMKSFDYLFHTMKISHKQMAESPRIFRTRIKIIQQRHGFLEKIGRAQYDPTQENYVSLQKLVENDVIFCRETAKRPLSEFNDYLKTL